MITSLKDCIIESMICLFLFSKNPWLYWSYWLATATSSTARYGSEKCLMLVLNFPDFLATPWIFISICGAINISKPSPELNLRTMIICSELSLNSNQNSLHMVDWSSCTMSLWLHNPTLIMMNDEFISMTRTSV